MRDPYREARRAYYAQLEFAERAHRRQMIGNVLTSMAQASSSNRPLQVATALGILKVGQGISAAIKGERNFWEKIGDPVQDIALTAGMVAYLTNSDGGVSQQYDIPDVESPGGGAAAAGAGGWFLPTSDPRALARSSRRRS